jgi:hypothetical protein
MKKYLLAAGGAMALACSSNAHAALVITITGPSGTFANNPVVCTPNPAPCAFADLANFITPVGYQLVGATISSIKTGGNNTNIDFTSVMLNGTNFLVSSTGNVEFRSLQNLLLTPGGNNILSVAGLSGGAASYAGTLSFAAVPEPSTWLMMILGIGLAGLGLRRRQSVKVSYA